MSSPDATHPSISTGFARLLLIAATTLLCCALASLPLFRGQMGLLLWPAAGIALACGWRYGLPWLIPASLSAGGWALAHTGNLALAATAVACTTAGPACAVSLIQRLGDWKPADFRVDALLRFVLVCALFCAPIDALVATTGLMLAGHLPAAGLMQAALGWWLLDSLGLLLVTPAILALLRPTSSDSLARPSFPIDFPTLSACAAVALASLALLRSGHPAQASFAIYLYAPIVTLSALRLNERSIALTLPLSALPLLMVHSLRAGPQLDALEAAHAPAMVLSAALVALLLQAIAADRRQALTNIVEQARQDLTTGLLNDRGLLNDLGERLASPGRNHYGLIGVHITNFDTIHDLCGPLQATSLEQSVAAMLTGQMRDRLAARLSSGRFALLVSSDTVAEVRTLAREIYSRLNSQVFQADHGSLRLQACVGGLLIDRQVAITAEDILLSLSDAMAIAASVRDPQLFVEPLSQAMIDARRSHQGKIEHIREAIRDRHLEVYAQPILDPAAPSASLSYEVLTRMRDRDGSLIRPPEFLPLAVQAQMTVALDRAVIQKVFTWLAANRWALERTHKCSINLSGQTMSDAMISTFIRQQRALCAIPPEKIVFEITESEAIRNPLAASRLVDELKADGFGIALDDFGTGLATFEYLKRFPLDYLKIDGSFIRNLVDNPIDQEIVLSTVRVAQHLKVRIVAEHVHNRSIYEHLRTLGVEQIQGDLIGIAMPIESLFAHHAKQGFAAPPTSVPPKTVPQDPTHGQAAA